MPSDPLENGFIRQTRALCNSNNRTNMVVVKRVRSRSGSLSRHTSSDSAHIRTTPEKTAPLHRPSSRVVCFAHDCPGCPDQVNDAPPCMTLEEMHAAFYTKEEIDRFDKDRALTALMYRTRKGTGVAWDDNVHSLRGLEEILHQKKTDQTKRQRRKELTTAILKEQERLQSESAQQDLAMAALSIKKAKNELYNELLRGVSCSMTKIDKQRAIGLAQKDEKAAGRNRTSSRRMLLALKTKLSQWVTTSNGSLAGSDSGNPVADDG